MQNLSNLILKDQKEQKEQKNLLEMLENLESLKHQEMFGIKDARVLAVSFKILVDSVIRKLIISASDNSTSDSIRSDNSTLDSIRSDNSTSDNGKVDEEMAQRVICMLLHWIADQRVQTFGPREIILKHFLVELFHGLLILKSPRIYDLLDSIPLTTAFKVLLSLNTRERIQVTNLLSELLQKDFGISSLMQVVPENSNKVKMLAKLLATVPLKVEKGDYYKNISRQLLLLLSEREQDLVKANLGAEIIIEIIENSSKEDVKEYFMDFLLYPSHLICDFTGKMEKFQLEEEFDLDGNLILVSEEELERNLIQTQLLLNNLKGKRRITDFLVKSKRVFKLKKRF